MMVEHASSALASLNNALERLSAPASLQIAYLDKLGMLPSVDELALELNDAVSVLSQLVEAGKVTSERAVAIRAVDRKLAEMSSRPNLWDEEALRDAPDWDDVRRLAGSAVGETLST